MTDERRVLELVEQALELPPGEREAFLGRQCGEDAQVRDSAAELLGLATDPERNAFLTPPPREDLERILRHPPQELVAGTRLGRYRLVRRLATGGMATVYEATQDNPTRSVALKILKLDVADETMRQRFAAEAEILAHLRHAGIAEVYEAGVAPLQGTPEPTRHPFIAMELLTGARPITEYARAEGLSRVARLRRFVEVCTAVHHGHQMGVIHRDLKPGNVLVDAEGRVKVIDFGVARATVGELGPAELTLTGQVLGTPVYMSPEQFTGGSLDLDLRTDVYSLGVVLHELLCDRPPHDLRGKAIHEIARCVVEETPPRPSDLVPDLSGDLEAILLKALEKDRERRYGSAAELADDLHRFLAHEPIEARPPSVAYRARRFVQRNRLLVGSSVVLAMVLVSATAVSVHYALDAMAERDGANRAKQDEARERARAEDLFHGSLALHLEFLEKYVGQIRQLAGASRLTAEMMASIATNLETVRAQSGDDPEASLLLARAWHELGRQRARSQGSHVAQYAEGRRNYENALELVRLVRAVDPERTDARRLEGSVLMSMGDQAVADDRLDDARELYEQRLALAEEWAAEDEDLDQLSALAAAYDRVGGIAGMSGDHETALECFQVVVDLAGRVVEANPTPGARREWGTAHGRVGGALQELGRYEESVAFYDDQLEVLDELMAESPDSADYAAQWVIVVELRSRAQIPLGLLDDAEDALSEAYDRVEALIAADPDDARLPVFKIAVTFGLGRVNRSHAEQATDELDAEILWEEARSWFGLCEETILDRQEKGLLQPAESGFLDTARAELARCAEHLER